MDSKLTLPLLVLALAVIVYGLYGFDDILLRDYSIYLYSGQRMAEGIPPYVSVFDHKGPLSPMLAGLGAAFSGLFNLDDVYTVRAVFFAAGCLAVVAVYLLGESVFRSRAAGFFAALALLGCYGFAQPVASGPEPKTPMVLFEALSLLFMVQKRWFWAGLFGSLAFLIWQPMAIFPFVAFLLAVARPREERYGAALRVSAGIATPLLVTLAYFYYHGATGDFLQGFVLFNFQHLLRGETPIVYHLVVAAYNIVVPYSTMLAPITIGLLTIVVLYFRRPYQYRFAPILLSFPAPILWSLDDFQLADDFYVFLPYAAIGFGAFLALAIRRARNPLVPAAVLSAILLGIALANTLDVVSSSSAQRLKGTTTDLNDQREGAAAVEARFGEDAKLASINSPQLMVLLEKENPNPYLWITAGVDRKIEATIPGGFEGWLQGLEEYDPDAITFFGDGQSLLPSHHLTEEHSEQLDSWLDPRYDARKIGPFWLFVNKETLAGEGQASAGS